MATNRRKRRLRDGSSGGVERDRLEDRRRAYAERKRRRETDDDATDTTDLWAHRKLLDLPPKPERDRYAERRDDPILTTIDGRRWRISPVTGGDCRPKTGGEQYATRPPRAVRNRRPSAGADSDDSERDDHQKDEWGRRLCDIRAAGDRSRRDHYDD